MLRDLFFSSRCQLLELTVPSLPCQQVINFDMPEIASGYIHRIGRTGRAYNSGVAVSLVSSFDTRSMKSNN